MKLSNINEWLVLVANIAILAGIALLVVELNQTRQSIQAQTRNEISVQIIDLLRDASLNPQLADIIGRGAAGGLLTQVEIAQFTHRTNAFLRYFENVNYQYQQGLYDETEYLGELDAWRGFFAIPSHHEIWCSWKGSFSARFRETIDGLSSIQPCEI